MLDKRIELSGDHFVANISLPENYSGGLTVIERDPRKCEYKPDCYVAIVEEVGPKCKFIKPGDKVVVERWEYTQLDIDESRLTAREIDVVVFNEEKLSPNSIAIQVVDSLREKYREESILLPETILTEPERYYFGKVMNSACKDIPVDAYVWVMKTDSNQFRIQNHTVVCRLTEDEAFLKGVMI